MRPTTQQLRPRHPASLSITLTVALAGLSHAGKLGPELPDGQAPAGFVSLFNGKDLSNFKAEDSKAFWRVEKGVLIGENDAALKGNYLWTEKSYSDFILEFDVRWTGEIDSGVEFRSYPAVLSRNGSRK